MRKEDLSYAQVINRFHSIVMIVLLLWLTVSTPYVFAAQQDVTTEQGAVEEDANPFSGTTEEKVESGSNTLSEYLHELHAYVPALSKPGLIYKFHPDALYSAFHPELLSPPPERVL